MQSRDLLPDLLGARGCDSWLCLGGGHFLFIIGSALTLIPAGFLCDRYGHRNVIITVLSCSILLFFTFLGVTALPFWALALLLLILGGFCGLTNPIIVSWGHKLVPENPSTISAILMGFAWCVGNLGPVAAGYIAKSFQENGFVLAMMIMGSLLPLKLIFAYAMPKPVPETNSTVETITADS